LTIAPTRVFVPWSTVIGRSVLIAHRQTGNAERRRLFLQAAESVSTSVAPAISRAFRDSLAAQL